VVDLYSWVPSLSERRRMLEAIGASDWRELYSDVPRELMLPEPPRVGAGRPLTEHEALRLVARDAGLDRVFRDPPPFTGGGLCYHHVPAVVEEVASRAEFYTAYTPYQPEINQGLLQALFEYQSLVADLLEMDVVNASMYDMSTAVAEAFLMAMRVTRRRRIIVPGTMHPEHLETAETWLMGRGGLIVKAPYDPETGSIDTGFLEEELGRGDVAAVYMEQPSSLGFIDPSIEEAAEAAHRHGALFIVGFEPISLGILKPPGRLGADIAVGEGQPLGLGLNYGGPLLGIMAVRGDRRLIRQMPGRIVGMTRSVEGERGFTLILQAREQHIRREKATSNITTNEALMAVRAAAYLALLGGEGLRRLAETIWYRSHYAAKRLRELGVEAPVFRAEFFKEFTARFPVPYRAVHRHLLGKGILGGLDLSRWGRSCREALFCITEAHSRRDIDLLVDSIAEALQEAGGA